MVNLVKDGEPLRMSKRAGTVVTLEDLVDAVGVDAARYALARSSSDSHARHRPRPADPAHQRQPGLLRAVRARPDRVRAAQRRRPRHRARRTSFRPELLDARARGRPARRPRRVPPGRRAAAELREPHRVARYLEELAGTYHRFYDACRVLPRGDEEVTDLTARPALAQRRHPPGARRTAWACSASPRPNACDPVKRASHEPRWHGGH